MVTLLEPFRCMARAMPVRMLAFLLCALSARAQGGYQTGFGLPILSWGGLGADFAQSSSTTRTAGVVNPTQVDPFQLPGVPIPAGAQVVEVILCWNYLLDGAAPAVDTITVNGQPVLGILTGLGYQTPIGWGKTGGACYLARFVSAIVPGVPATIAGACDKPLGGDPQALGEGLTALVAYVFAADKPVREAHAWVGFKSALLPPSAAPLQLPHPVGHARPHLFMNALDGELALPDEFWMGVSLSSSPISNPVGGLLAGTHQSGNAFAGLTGPLAHDNLYDVVDARNGILEILMDTWAFGGTDRIYFGSTYPAGGEGIAQTLAAYSCEVLGANPNAYCIAKTSSQGCTPSVSTHGPWGTGTGQPVSGAGDFDVLANGLPPASIGMLVFSLGSASTPFHGGTLCVAAPIGRTRLASTGGIVGVPCSGSLSLRINSPGSALNQVPGTSLFFQAWYRDAGDPFGDGVSDAVELTFH